MVFFFSFIFQQTVLYVNVYTGGYQNADMSKQLALIAHAHAHAQTSFFFLNYLKNFELLSFMFWKLKWFFLSLFKDL